MTKTTSEYSLPQQTTLDKYHDYHQVSVHGRSRLGTIAGFGRRWFVKSLAPNLSETTSGCQTLRKEYEILLSLNHPGIARPIELTEIPEVGLSIIMEYVQGTDFDTAVKGSGRKERRKLARQLIDAVAHMHSRGVTHGDLKPSNILVDTTGSDPRIKLIDFNLSDSSEFTIDKEAGGNRRYAAPEQFTKGYRLRPSADVWSLGKLLKELNPGATWYFTIRKALREDTKKRLADGIALKKSLSATKAMTKYLGFFFILICVALISLLIPGRERKLASETVLADTAMAAEVEPKASTKEVIPVVTIVDSEEKQTPIIKGKENYNFEEKEDYTKYTNQFKETELDVAEILNKGDVEFQKVLNDDSLALKLKHGKLCDIILSTSNQAINRITQFFSSLPQEYQLNWPSEWNDLITLKPIHDFTEQYQPLIQQMINEIQSDK